MSLTRSPCATRPDHRSGIDVIERRGWLALPSDLAGLTLARPAVVSDEHDRAVGIVVVQHRLPVAPASRDQVRAMVEQQAHDLQLSAFRGENQQRRASQMPAKMGEKENSAGSVGQEPLV